MDDTRLRAVIREEVALAMKTLGEVAGSVASSYGDDQAGERDGAYAIESAAGVYFESAYEADCTVADEQRAADAENPFTEAATGSADEAVQKLVRDEVLNVLKEMQSAFYGSGIASDYSIAERLNSIIAQREE